MYRFEEREREKEEENWRGCRGIEKKSRQRESRKRRTWISFPWNWGENRRRWARGRGRKIFKRPSRDKYRDRVAGYQGIDPRVDLRHTTTTTKSDSRSGRVSLRSVALFVNAELRARARVTGSSRKASWGFMVPPFGSDQKRRGKEERGGGGGGGNRGGGGGWGRRVGQWTWVSTDSRQVQGRTVAPRLRSPSLRCAPRVLQSPPPLPTNCRQTLGTISLASLGFTRDGWMDGWMGWEARHAQLFAYTLPLLPLHSLFLSARLFRVSLRLLAFRKTSK